MTDISICMVSLDCWDVFKDCMESLRENRPSFSYEIIVVDNSSSDGTPENIKKYFPDVRLIRNDRNVGFTVAINQAIKISSGRYILLLNTDTILNRDTLFKLYQFMEENPQVGIVGPKVLNPDGTFQPQCKRGMPTPLASLFYISKLDRLWPQSPIVGQYLLVNLPENESHQVASVSGCCLMARREVWQAIGPFDENIFGFGEDIDWCVRARNAGWQVWYYPGSSIIHLKGHGGVHAKPYKKVWAIHQAMWIFYHKHLMPKYLWPVTVSVWLGVKISLILSIIQVWLRQLIRLPLRRQG
jgi:hypothetical protein